MKNNVKSKKNSSDNKDNKSRLESKCLLVSNKRLKDRSNCANKNKLGFRLLSNNAKSSFFKSKLDSKNSSKNSFVKSKLVKNRLVRSSSAKNSFNKRNCSRSRFSKNRCAKNKKDISNYSSRSRRDNVWRLRKPSRKNVRSYCLKSWRSKLSNTQFNSSNSKDSWKSSATNNLSRYFLIEFMSRTCRGKLKSGQLKSKETHRLIKSLQLEFHLISSSKI